jgi:hypothetical protein
MSATVSSPRLPFLNLMKLPKLGCFALVISSWGSCRCALGICICSEILFCCFKANLNNCFPFIREHSEQIKEKSTRNPVYSSSFNNYQQFAHLLQLCLSSFLLLCLLFFFSSSWAWTHSFIFLKQVLYCLSHAFSPFCFDCFGDRVSLFAQISLDFYSLIF